MTARRRRGGGRCALVLGALVLAACGSSADGAGVGADAERPAEPAMELVTFTDVAAEVGLEFRHGAFQWDTTGDIPAQMGGGVCWLDYDGDGWMDLFATNTWSDGEWGRWRQEGGLPTSQLFRNEEGRFVDVSAETGAALEMRANGCVAADLDNDGHTDLYVTSDRANALLWNVDGERFEEGATAAGVDVAGWHSGAAVGDLNGDGLLDLYVVGYADMNRPVPTATRGFPNTFEPVADVVLVNQGAVAGARPTFVDVAAEVGVEPTRLDHGLGAVMTDVDDDGDLDVYVANDTQPNRLYRNRPEAGGAGFAFDEVGIQAGVGDDNAGMGVAAGDYDGDGIPDLVVSNHEDQVTNVFRSDPAVGFVDALGEIGQPDLALDLTGWGASWFDADLDADVDLMLVHGFLPVTDLAADREPIVLYEHDAGSGTFGDASAVVGLDRVGPRLGRGSAAADVDNDGDLDVAVGTIGDDLVLLRNSGAGGRWLTVAPEPATPGTVVTVTGGAAGDQRRELQAGSSYLSSEDPRLHVGLGAGIEAVTVTVTWPDGTEVELADVEVDRILAVEARR